MKSLFLSLVVTFSIASSSFASKAVAATEITAGNLARELANTLHLNELQYLKIKGFETKKLDAIKNAETTLTGDALAKQLVTIETAFSASVLEILMPNQKKVYLGMKNLMATTQAKQ